MFLTPEIVQVIVSMQMFHIFYPKIVQGIVGMWFKDVSCLILTVEIIQGIVSIWMIRVFDPRNSPRVCEHVDFSYF